MAAIHLISLCGRIEVKKILNTNTVSNQKTATILCPYHFFFFYFTIIRRWINMNDSLWSNGIRDSTRVPLTKLDSKRKRIQKPSKFLHWRLGQVKNAMILSCLFIRDDWPMYMLVKNRILIPNQELLQILLICKRLLKGKF